MSLTLDPLFSRERTAEAERGVSWRVKSVAGDYAVSQSAILYLPMESPLWRIGSIVGDE
jgi:hypothetical protein